MRRSLLPAASALFAASLAVGPAMGEGARAALDWPGYYRGVAPCLPPCSGVEMRLYLQKKGASALYRLIETRHGRFSRRRETLGEARWLDASRLSVLSKDGQRVFFIGEGRAFLLRAGETKLRANAPRLTKISDATEPDDKP